MNIFKKKSLCAALAGIGALGAAGAAQAVNLNPDGLGQVLIYPYYTTRADANGNAYFSLISVVNTTASVKSVKVRFLEGKNSREVLDFNLYLSMHDVWVAAIEPTADGAAITSPDVSCTLPVAVSQGQTIPFRNGAYAGIDGGGSTLDRTREGYAEIIEMATYDDGSTTHDNVTHVNGVPPGCSKQTDALGASEALPPTGGLIGGMTLINVNAGTDYTEDAVAVDNFSVISLYTGAGVDTPNLTSATPPISVVVANNNVYQSSWAPSTGEVVSAVLMHDQIMNEYVLDTATSSATDWVVTMPTKRFFVGIGTGVPDELFQSNFSKDPTDCGAPDDFDPAIYDREENTTSSPLDFSPQPTAGVNSLCWEANVITFQPNSVLASVNTSTVIPPAGFEHGWLNIGWLPSTVTGSVHKLINFGGTQIAPLGQAFGAPGTATYVGLPVVGFAVQSFTNGAVVVNGVNTLSNYGGNFVQKGTRLIE